MLNKKSVFIIVCFILMNAVAFALMSPTIQQKGRWESLSSFLVCEAKINDKSERVCLPRLMFDDEVDMDALFSQVQEGLKAQEAIFQLYHDGLGSPKKQNGMFFASDVFLKDLDMTYTGYLRTLGYNFTLSNKPAYEDDEYMGEVLVGESANDMIRSVKKAEKEKREKEAKKEKPGSKSNLRVTTVYDMLPEGVIPPSIRSQQLKIAAIVNNLKNRPYETEIIQIDPLRWASGYMGQLNEKGEIDMAKVEGQVVDDCCLVGVLFGLIGKRDVFERYSTRSFETYRLALFFHIYILKFHQSFSGCEDTYELRCQFHHVTCRTLYPVNQLQEGCHGTEGEQTCCYLHDTMQEGDDIAGEEAYAEDEM